MVPTPRQLLLGREPHRRLWPAVAVVLFVGTFAAYAVGVFHIPGGVVFIPGQAALVGLLGAGIVGYARGGLLFAWLVCYGALLGNHADHAFMGLSHRTRVEQAAYFFELDGLGAYAVMAVVLGLLAFAVGALARWGYETLRPQRRASAD
ncbi:hypothetical protein [Halorarius litoreus]|uniref:hypothetical protein n=1 Tax=Halorarius litoreus TaxID=2962676 RepID=UPI0020CE986E|nr:hypothetical protein [Halorarius litoreus]